MNNLSCTELKKFIHDCQIDDNHRLANTLNELLALREAGKEPVRRVNADQMHRVCLEAARHLDKYGAMAMEVNKLLGRIPAPQLPAVHDDTRRMDWLCSMVVDVREPLVYGSHSIFWSQCDSADDEPHHTTLREQIDVAIAAAPKPE